MKPPWSIVEARENGFEFRVGEAEPVALQMDAATVEIDVLAAAIAGALDSAKRSGVRDVDVLLHPPLVQVRILVDVPPVRPRDLADLIGNQRARFFRPLSGEAVVAAERVRANGSSHVLAALAEVELLQRMESAFEVNGLRIRRFLPVSGTNGHGPPLLSPNARRRQRRLRRTNLLAAGCVAISGWIAAGATYLFDLSADERAVALELERLEGPLQRIESLRARVAEFAPIAEAFERQAGETASLQKHLIGLVAALPPDAHLHRIADGPDGAVLVEAHGQDALAAVENVAAWWKGQVRLDGAPERDSSDTSEASERFTLVLELGS